MILSLRQLTMITSVAIAMSLCGTATAQSLPPDEEGALVRLNSSPRHGEWVTYDAVSYTHLTLPTILLV